MNEPRWFYADTPCAWCGHLFDDHEEGYGQRCTVCNCTGWELGEQHD